MTSTADIRRYPELDACRGIAIGMMVLFHLLFDLSFFSLYPIDLQHGLWRIFGYSTAVLFVLIAGMAVAIRAGRTPSSPGLNQYFPYFSRGLFLVSFGCLITGATYIFLKGEGYVLFGILHLIGVATLLAPLFFRLKHLSIIPGILILIMSGFTLPEGPLWLCFLGIHPAGFYSVDYTPLIPWFGVFLIGLGAGFFLYPNGLRRWTLSEQYACRLSFPAFLGRHSLGIYLIHQPILIGLLSLISGRILGQ